MNVCPLPDRIQTKKWDLPIFIATRQKGRENKFRSPRTYINKVKSQYEKDWFSYQESREAKLNAKCSDLPHCSKFIKYPQFTSRLDYSIKDESLAPNLYTVKHPAEIVKVPTFVKPPSKSDVGIHNYDRRPFCTKSTKLDTKLQHTFRADERSLKPYSRNMISSLVLCYRDPNEPGPGHYNPRRIRKNRSPVYRIRDIEGLPWRFYKNSSVPVKHMNEIRRKPSRIAPGIYNPFATMPKLIFRRRRSLIRRSLQRARQGCTSKFLKPMSLYKALRPDTTDVKTITFNTLRRGKMKRKALSRRKNVAFMSSQGRFKGEPYVTIQNKPIVAPIAKKVVNCGVTKVPIKYITSKYLNIPTKPRMRKKRNVPYILRLPFLPTPKVLVSAADFEFSQGFEGGFFYRPIQHEDYFRKERQFTRISTAAIRMITQDFSL